MKISVGTMDRARYGPAYGLFGLSISALKKG